MSLPIVFLDEARDELDEAYAWYEQQRAGLGEEFLTAVREALERIRGHPTLYAQIYQTARHASTKRFPYGVYFRVESERIVVLSVFHGRRDPRDWQRRA